MRFKTALIFIIGILLVLSPKPNGSNIAQEKKEKTIEVSESVIDDCAEDKWYRGVYKLQIDSLVKNQTKPLNIKEKGLWAGIGAAAIIILRLLIK